MPFNAATRVKARQMTDYWCCICDRTGNVEVYRIIPKKHVSSDGIDNAVPLCSYRNANSDANPKNRKDIKKLRDWWYKMTELKYPESVTGRETVHEINRKVKEAQKGFSGAVELKRRYKPLVNSIMERVTPTTFIAVASGVVDTVWPYVKEVILC
jgi:hypothetical protein